MRKKTICLVCDFPPPPGGMTNQALILEDCLSSIEGFNVKRCKVNIKFPLRFKFLEKFILAKILFKFPVILYRLLITISKSDVVHIFAICGLYFYVVVTPAVLLSKLFGKRVIVNYHAGYFTKFYQNSFKFLVRLILNWADYVITPLLYLEKEFSTVGVKISRVSNLVDLTEYKFKQRDAFSPKLITTRHLRHVYGNDTVLRAFEIITHKYPEATLIIAGDGEDREKLETLAEELGVIGNTLFTGYVDKDVLLEHYNSSDLFLNGSRRDNMPISILEAFALGLVVVSTNPMGIPYLVQDTVTGLLSSIDDHSALAENTLKILGDSQYGRELVSNAKQYVDTLTWKNIYADLSRVYFNSVVSG